MKATGRIRSMLWSIFFGCLLLMLVGACSAIIGEEVLPAGVESLKLDLSFPEFMFLYIVVCEVFPFLKGKPANVLYNILKLVKRFKK